MIPWHQSLFDLMDVKARETKPALRTNRRGRPLAAALVALHETEVSTRDAGWFPLTDVLERATRLKWLDLDEALEQRFRRSAHPVWMPIADDGDSQLVIPLDEGDDDPWTWCRETLGVGVSPLDSRLCHHLASVLVRRAHSSLPWPAWRRADHQPLVEPAIDWLLEHGATQTREGAVHSVVQRSERHVVRVTADRTSNRASWFVGARNPEGLPRALAPLARLGLAPAGL